MRTAAAGCHRAHGPPRLDLRWTTNSTILAEQDPHLLPAPRHLTSHGATPPMLVGSPSNPILTNRQPSSTSPRPSWPDRPPTIGHVCACPSGDEYDLCGSMSAMPMDPVETNPDHYRVIFENDRVRVLEYADSPSDRTTPHEHPDSVMYTLSSFRRRLHLGEIHRDVEIGTGGAHWVPAQQHAGENIGDTPTHAIFVELKEPAPAAGDISGIGPSTV
jgi:beta-alanine degradation protein BauB